MPAFNFPASPIAGDTVVNADSGITYQWQAEGFWKSIKYETVELTPPMFAFKQDGPPASDAVELLRLVIPAGQQLDLSTFDYSLSANPTTGQDFDILVNNVRSTDQIQVSNSGVVTIVDTRGPYTGPVTLTIYAELGQPIDPTFAVLTVVKEIATV
jgi:hypothetical protein